MTVVPVQSSAPAFGTQEELAQAKARSRLLNRLSAASITLALLLLALLFASLHCDIGGGPALTDGGNDGGTTTPDTFNPPRTPARRFFVLRFAPSEDDDSVIRPAWARLLPPDAHEGQGLTVDATRSVSPTEEFRVRLTRTLERERERWSGITRILVEDLESPTGQTTITQEFRRTIEGIIRQAFPELDQVEWVKTRELDRQLAASAPPRGASNSPGDGSRGDGSGGASNGE